MLSTIVDSISRLFVKIAGSMGVDVLFFLALAVEALIVIFFLVKSIFSYEAKLNRALEKLNFWLFEKKTVTEDNIKELNALFKTKAPKRLCYYWQQYILFRKGAPSSYLSTDNLVEKPMKTSSYNANIKNLTLISCLWALLSGVLILAGVQNTYLTGIELIAAISTPVFVLVLGIVFIVYLRARKNSILNALYQNTQLFGRFMDNACVDLPTYIDYQILFTPQEIESGQPVLREFLDYKARKEKEEFNRAREENVDTESFDFSSTGVDGSIVLDRAMRESELYLKKKEKSLLKVSQLEAQLDSHKKNFDNVQKDFQTKIQASKENVDRLRQMQEETTNRIESNYYRKQQTQEIAKQEQLEQEFEQQRTKYMLERNEGEEEIAKLNAQLEADKFEVENAMISEYQTFFDKFCKSAEKVVGKVFEEKISALKAAHESDKEYITQLEIKLKNKPSASDADEAQVEEGQYDENGNYVYANGTYYDKDGNFHDLEGNVYSQDGKLISKAEEPKQEEAPKVEQVVDFDDFDAFDFMTDTTQKGDIYGVAEDIVEDIDKSIEVVNNTPKNDPLLGRAATEEENKESMKEALQPKQEEAKQEVETNLETSDAEKQQTEVPVQQPAFEEFSLEEEEEESTPAKRRGRPKKVETEEALPGARKAGRPRKNVEGPTEPKKSVGRPKKIVKEEPVSTEKRGRGRPKKSDSIEEINKKLSEEEARLNEMRTSLNKDLESAMSGMNASVDDKIARREQLIKEIDRLQKEAQQVILNNEPDSKIADINKRLEALMAEIKQLN